MQKIFMKRAIELAKKGCGFTSPNPCVGAVIVKGGKIVAEGWHNVAGGDHAEVNAIKKVMKKSGIVTRDIDPMLFHNAILYVNLEPCCHTGKTPPCTEAIINSGFKKVCIGMYDPNKKVYGKGIRALRDKGIMVEVCRNGSDIAEEVRSINQPFIKWASKGVPYVVMKSGMSIDGKISTYSGKSKWITSVNSRDDSKNYRSMCDSVLIGAGTVIADNPELGVTGKYKNKNLLRIIIDKRLSLSFDSKVFRDKNVFVACTDLASDKNREKFRKKGVKFKSFGKDEVSIKALLKYLGKNGIQSVFVEGGSGINGAFYDAALRNRDVLDKVIYYIAPKVIGGEKSLPVIGGKGVDNLTKALEFEEMNIERIGKDIKIEGILNYY